MEKNLTIVQSASEGRLFLDVSGRLDANWAGYLDDTLRKAIEEGHYVVGLDLSKVQFLSSAGIRTLVKQHKAFSAVSGVLSITAYSENVGSVLDMVGMLQLFLPAETAASEALLSVPTEEVLREYGYTFKVCHSGDACAQVSSRGNPGLLAQAGFTAADDALLRLEKPFFGLGLGALGSDFDDCKSRYGEFIALGDHLAYVPSDASGKPDYMTRIGNLIPEIHTLYSLGVEESFSRDFIFTPETEKSIELSRLLQIAFKLNDSEDIAFLMFAESAGLVGANLLQSPVEGTVPFSFPEVRERVNFTTEPIHNKALCVLFGLACRKAPQALNPFLRPLMEGVLGHVHAAVFPYMPLQKEQLEYRSTLELLFEKSEVLDVLHLLRDSRESVGLGESLFRSGHCWTAGLKF
ncbi:MAG: STAS domain-containing protein [Opitutales bacterium]|nr:STAS domain-containing protein [Opitutales bacterium]